MSESKAPKSDSVGNPDTMGRTDKLPIQMLQDRLLVRVETADGERRSTGGILIPATAQIGKRGRGPRRGAQRSERAGRRPGAVQPR